MWNLKLVTTAAALRASGLRDRAWLTRARVAGLALILAGVAFTEAPRYLESLASRRGGGGSAAGAAAGGAPGDRDLSTGLPLALLTLAAVTFANVATEALYKRPNGGAWLLQNVYM